MSSDQSYIDDLARNCADAPEDHASPYVIMVFPDGILFTSTGGVHEGRMEGILADYDDSGSVWSELDGIFCMLIRTDNTTDAVNEIRDNLTENYAEDEHIYEDDMSHDYDTICLLYTSDAADE